MIGNMQQRQFFRITLRDFIDDVEREIEPLEILESDVPKAAALVFKNIEIPVNHQRSLVGARTDRLKPEMRVPVFAGHDHRQKSHALGSGRAHTVRSRGFVVDGITLVKPLDMIADTDIHRALEHDVVFMAGVSGGGDGLIHQPLVVLVCDPIRRTEAVLEHRRLIADRHVRLRRGHRPLPRTGHLVARKMRAVPFKQSVDVDAERNRALVQKVEGGVELSRFHLPVFRHRHAGIPGHLLFRKTDDLAHFTNARGHLLQLVLGFFAHHNGPDSIPLI